MNYDAISQEEISKEVEKILTPTGVCSCLHVEYRPIPCASGGVYESWACRDCGTKFNRVTVYRGLDADDYNRISNENDRIRAAIADAWGTNVPSGDPVECVKALAIRCIKAEKQVSELKG